MIRLSSILDHILCPPVAGTDGIFASRAPLKGEEVNWSVDVMYCDGIPGIQMASH